MVKKLRKARQGAAALLFANSPGRVGSGQVPCAEPGPPTMWPDPEVSLADPGRWEISEGIQFSVLASLVLWSLILVNLHLLLT